MERVAVVIVTYNSAGVLPSCLAALPGGLEGLDWRLVVVDNASTDHSLDLAREASPAPTCVALRRNAGYAAGINAGTRAAGDVDALLVLNPDVRLEPGAVHRLLTSLSASVGIAVPQLVDEDGRRSPSLRRDPTVLRALGEAVLGGRRAGRFARWGEVIVAPDAYTDDRDVDWATGACMLISRECAEKTGDWEESYFLYSEETDYALRARREGFRVRYVAAARAAHTGGQAHVSPQLWAMLTASRVCCFRRHHEGVRPLLFWFAVVLNETLRLSGGPTHRAALTTLLRMHPHPGREVASRLRRDR